MANACRAAGARRSPRALARMALSLPHWPSRAGALPSVEAPQPSPYAVRRRSATRHSRGKRPPARRTRAACRQGFRVSSRTWRLFLHRHPPAPKRNLLLGDLGRLDLIGAIAALLPFLVENAAIQAESYEPGIVLVRFDVKHRHAGNARQLERCDAALAPVRLRNDNFLSRNIGSGRAQLQSRKDLCGNCYGSAFGLESIIEVMQIAGGQTTGRMRVTCGKDECRDQGGSREHESPASKRRSCKRRPQTATGVGWAGAISAGEATRPCRRRARSATVCRPQARCRWAYPDHPSAP